MQSRLIFQRTSHPIKCTGAESSICLKYVSSECRAVIEIASEPKMNLAETENRGAFGSG